MRIVFLGCGTWGLALASQLAQKHEIVVWGRNQAQIELLTQTRTHPRLKGIVLAPSICFTSDIAQAFVKPPDSVWIATSVAGLASVSQLLRAQISRDLIPHLVLIAKGFSAEDGALPHQIVKAILDKPIAVLTGPSFAQEVAQGLPVALLAASKDLVLARQVQALAHLPMMRVYAADDLLGAEIGGAIKNILAIACGISDGCALGLNARAALLTRGLSEMIRFGVAQGARAETFFGLSGMGDLVLTATGDLSRNRQAGLLLAQGLSLKDIQTQIGSSIEGVRCVEQVCAMARRGNIEMPITETVGSVLFHQMPIKKAIDVLLQRNLKSES